MASSISCLSLCLPPITFPARPCRCRRPTHTAPQFVPQNVTCLPLDSRSIKVSWIIPSSLKNLFIEGFYIAYRFPASSDPFTYKTMHVPLHPAGSVPAAGSSPESGSGSGNAGARDRNPPSSSSSGSPLSSSGVSISSSIIISGSTSSSFSSASSLRDRENNSNFNTQQRNADPFAQRKFEYIIDQLRKSTKYSIIVQAFNAKGAGPTSPETTVSTFANGTRVGVVV